MRINIGEIIREQERSEILISLLTGRYNPLFFRLAPIPIPVLNPLADQAVKPKVPSETTRC